jgi:RimJ/RimL family protein N-acetyltransferase
MTEISTSRLRIKKLIPSEAPGVADLITEKISRWTAVVPWPYELADAEWWITNSTAEKGLGIYLNGSLIGAISVPSCDGDEVGFWVNEKFEGMGYVTEAATAIINYSFSVKGLKVLDSFVHRDNIGSRRVHEKLGFKIIGDTENYWPNKNATVPVIHYRLEKQA